MTAIIRACLKNRILNETDFVGNLEQYREILGLVQRTIEAGESNSVLLIGPRGSGKTTLVNNVLRELQPHFSTDAVLVRLHGLIQTDDRLALKSITSQMCLDNAVDGKVFGSFADNLTFLLACLKSGLRDSSKSVIFVLEDFDLFCCHHNQTLLYNLFDVSQSAQTSICVLGITCRLDVIELLEKRVKSRFSHRQIFLFAGSELVSNLEHKLQRLSDFLLFKPNDKIDISNALKKQWNTHIATLLKLKEFRNLIQRFVDFDLSERCLKNLLIVVISQLDDANQWLTCDAFRQQLKEFEKDEVVEILSDLSVLELTLIIAMKHHCEIYDNQAMNFEMIYTRYVKFANSNSNIQTADRAVVMKAFEQIQNLELVALVSGGNSGLQKEYQLFKLLVLPQQINQGVRRIVGLPTEVVQYASTSLL